MHRPGEWFYGIAKYWPRWSQRLSDESDRQQRRRPSHWAQGQRASARALRNRRPPRRYNLGTRAGRRTYLRDRYRARRFFGR